MLVSFMPQVLINLQYVKILSCEKKSFYLLNGQTSLHVFFSLQCKTMGVPNDFLQCEGEGGEGEVQFSLQMLQAVLKP